jgi:hypothetical protein
LQNEFSDAGPVVFETQVYNDLFELVYGNAIQLQLRDDKGKTSNYNYTTTPGGSRYRIGGLKEGVYRYKATTTVNNRTEEVNGQFLVKAQNLELQNLTADFQLLRRLAAETGGTRSTAGIGERPERNESGQPDSLTGIIQPIGQPEMGFLPVVSVGFCRVVLEKIPGRVLK